MYTAKRIKEKSLFKRHCLFGLTRQEKGRQKVKSKRTLSPISKNYKSTHNNIHRGEIVIKVHN